MSAQEYLKILRLRWRVVTGVLVAALVLTATATLLVRPEYTARSEVFFSVGLGRTPRDLASGFGYAQGLARSYARVATLPVVLVPVKERLGLDDGLSDLSASVVARAPVDTVLVEILATADDPDRSAAVANAVAEELTSVVTRLSSSVGTVSNPLQLATVTRAVPPTGSSSPRTTLNLGLATVLGLLAGVAAAVAVESRDARIRTRRGLGDVTSAPVLGVLARPRTGVGALLHRGTSPDDGRTTQLRVRLQRMWSSSRPGSVLFTSAADVDLTTGPTVGLALELARDGLQVLVVDADLRRPTLAAHLGVDEGAGLSAVLRGRVRWTEVVRRVPDSSLWVVPAGPAQLATRGAGVGSAEVRELIADALSRYDLVLLKTAPVLHVADSLLLSSLVDAVVVVADERRTRRASLTEEMQALHLVGARVLGVVLTA